MKRLCCCLWLILYGGAAAFSQSASKPPVPLTLPQPDDPTLRIATALLQLEVFVTDRNGKPIRDLKREDFELRGDKRRR